MTDRHKTIGAAPLPTAPVSFTIEAQNKNDETESETFHCKPWVPGTVVMEATSLLGTTQEYVATFELFAAAMRGVITDETRARVAAEEDDNDAPVDEFGRFRDWIDSPDRYVGVEAVAGAFFHLCQEYGRRPTQRSAASAVGPESTSDTSTPDA